MGQPELEPFRDRVPRRPTGTCPVCTGTVRKMRRGDQWLCDGCARHLEVEEVLDIDPGGEK